MDGVTISVYATVEELTGSAPTEAQFINGLRRYSLYSVLRTCSLLGLLLEIWKYGVDADITQQQLYFEFFPSHIATHLTMLLWATPEHKRFLFHRRQLLLIQKYAIAHCSTAGADAFGNKTFGATLLAANDLLGHGPAVDKVIATPEQAAAYITLMLTVSEYSTHRPAQNMARGRQLLREIPNELGYTNVLDEAFKASSKLSIEKYLGLFIAALAPFCKYNGVQWVSRIQESFLVAGSLKTEGTTLEEIAAFLNFVSASPSYIKAKSQDKFGLPANFTGLRDGPLVELAVNVGRLDQLMMFVPIDIEFLIDKLLAGPFWEIRRAVPDFEAKYWGKIFETYVTRLLSRTTAKTGMQLICNPKYSDDSSAEVSDAILLAGENLILIEIKTCMMSVQAKYSDSGAAMNESLKRCLVGDEKKPKAVIQLARAMQNLFGKGAKRAIHGISLTDVKRCFCLIVTLDYIGSSPGVAMYVNMHLAESLKNVELDVTCEGGFSVAIEELEYMTGYFAEASLSDLLVHWKTLNPSLGRPFGSLPFARKWVSPEWLNESLHSVFEDAVKNILPSDYKEKWAATAAAIQFPETEIEGFPEVL